MQFHKLYCNYAENPSSVGQNVRFSWNYENTYRRGLGQTYFEVRLGENPSEFRTVFRGTDAFQCVLPASCGLKERTRYCWQVYSRLSDGEECLSHVKIFETGLFSKKSWEEAGAHWISYSGDRADGVVSFEREFRLPDDRELKSVKAYVFGQGIAHLLVNGKIADGRMLAPANSVYSRHCYYETYDITDRMMPEYNSVAVHCGSGYNSAFSKYGNRYIGKQGVIALLDFKFTDGYEVLIPADRSWTCRTTDIVRASIYGGETYAPAGTGNNELSVVISDETAPYYQDGELVPREIPGITMIKEVQPVKVTPSVIPARKEDKECGIRAEDPIPGILYDFGEVSAGVVRLRYRASRGTVIRLSHFEMIYPDGSPDRYTNRLAAARDTIVAEGTGEEFYIPMFTYHSFRYVHIAGLEDSQVISIEKCVLSSALEQSGTFECGSAAVMRIHGLMLTGMRNNLFSYPTDCAVRDERTPCAMDSQAIEKSVMYNFNTSAYYSKWLCDVADNLKSGNGNPDWTGDLVSLIYRIYRFYGDIRPAEKYYERALDLFDDYMERSDDGVYTNGFGDWCAPNENSWETFFSSVPAVETALLYGIGQKLKILGTALGKEQAVLDRLDASCAKIRAAFEKACVNPDGSIGGGRQTELCMPLYEGLLSPGAAEKAEKLLTQKLEKEKSTDIGIFGAMSLYEVLCSAGKYELALELLENPEYPGYGFLLAKGATSLWEQWRYKGRMDSHSHGMFAGPDAAFYRMFAGISPLEPGFTRVEIKPQVPHRMGFARATLETAAGHISVSTEYLCRGYELKLTVPINCTAELTLPDPPEEGTDYAFFDGELPATFSKHMTLGSGNYDFRLVPAELQTDH